MSNRAELYDTSEEPSLSDAPVDEGVSADLPDWLKEEKVTLDNVRIPRIAIHVFGETEEFAQVWARVAADRRLTKANATYFDGGFVAAIKHYMGATTPELLIVETQATLEILQYELDSLAEVCDAGTRVIIVGHHNDIQLYRKLLQLGVSNYAVFPLSISSIIDSIAEIYNEPGTEKVGRSYAFIGAKGGVGSSTLAQNVAFEMASAGDAEVLLVDMDVPFGTGSLNLDVEPNQGLLELLDRPDQISAETIDRVLVRRGPHLNLIGAVPGLEVDRPIDSGSVGAFLDAAQQHLPFIILDVPHVWSTWTRQVLTDADRIVVVATPEIACLRNAAGLIERLGQMRPNDPKPLLALTQVGVPKRSEVSAKEIATTLKVEPVASIPFDPRLYSEASAKGKLICEVDRRRPASLACRSIAAALDPRRPSASAGRTRRFTFSRRKR